MHFLEWTAASILFLIGLRYVIVTAVTIRLESRVSALEAGLDILRRHVPVAKSDITKN